MAKKPASSAEPATAARTLGPDCRIVVLYGPETFLRTEYTSHLRQALETAHGQVEVLTFDGKTAEPAVVLDECRSLGLIAIHKMIVVDEAEQFVKESTRAMIERYAQHPEPGATLVLRAGTWRAGKLDDLVAQVGILVRCEAPQIMGPGGKPTGEVDWEKLARWAIARGGKRHGASMTPDVAMLLVQRVGESMGRIDNEIQKLALAAAGNEDPESRRAPGSLVAITTELIDQHVGLSREEEAWAIQRTLLAGDPQGGVAHVRQLMDVSREPAVLITYAMTDLARKLHAMSHVMQSGGNAWSAAGKLKIWGPAKDAIIESSRRADPARLHQLLSACINADRRQKSGLGDSSRTVERLTLEFAWVFGGQGSRRRG